MRRPLVVLFLGFAAGCLLCWYGGTSLVFVLFVVFLAAGGLFCFKKPTKRAGIITVCFVMAAVTGGTATMAAELSRAEPLLTQAGNEAVITGRVMREQTSIWGRSLLVQPEGNFLSRRRVWIVVAEEEPENRPWTGWRIRVKGRTEPPDFARNPGGFDQRAYLRTLGAQAVVKTKGDGVTVLSGRTSAAAKFRWRLQQRWEPVMGSRSCGGLMSLLFGVSDGMEEDTLSAFRRVGLGHLLAVSGLHVGLVYGAVQKLLGERGKSPLAQGLCVLSAAGYAALAGFSPSASRAALMIVIHSAGRVLKRPYDMATAASVAGMIILIGQPCQIVSGGFQLSLLAAFGMACVLPRIRYSLEILADKKRSKVLRLTAEKGSAAITVQLVMTPVCARRFHCFSLWSLPLNPICIALAGCLIPMAMLLSVITVLSDEISLLQPLFCLLGRLTGAVTAGMMNLGKTAAGLPGNYTRAGLPPGMLALYYCALFTACSEKFFLLLRRKQRVAAIFCSFVLAVFSCFFPFWAGITTSPLPAAYPGYPLVFVDVGQGDCFHMKTPRGRNILIDGGGSAFQNVGKDTLLPYLLHCGVTSVDLALATHLHIDHFQGIRELSEEIPIRRLGVYEANEFRDRKDLGSVENVIYFKEGSRIEIEPEIWIEVLAPPKRNREEYEKLAAEDSDENLSCLVFLVQYRGLRILITGDLGMEGEKELLERSGGKLPAHILKVGHHGSKYSTSEEFLEAVGPQAAFVGVGKNNFGHPSERVIELLEKNGIMIGRTDCHGALMIKGVKRGQAEVISENGEVQWHIDLEQNPQKTKNTPIKRYSGN